MQLTALLQAAQSADASVRTQAEQTLSTLQQQQYGDLCVGLSAELADASKPVDARRLAGLILKNTLDAKEDARKTALVQQWLAADEGMRKQVKLNLLATLGTQGDAGHTAALVIAKVAAIEVPRKQWPELIEALLANMGATPSSRELRQSTLEALGYTCEELGNLDDDFLSQLEVNSILTAVVQGMRKEEPEVDVRHAATVALQNALTFAHNNFSNDSERNYVMQIICEGTLADNSRIRQASWECLACIASGYYDKLPSYMQDIFSLTQRTVKGDEEDVVLQALEFWCTVAEEELERDGDGTDADSVNHNFIRAALPHLVPLLLEQLTKQEEGQEADDGVWNVAMAAGTCLALCASVAEDAVVPLVMPYVTANIQKTDGPESWRAREAATFAFGSILEGPGVDTLGQLVQSGLGFLLTALKQDPSAYVKDTTAWTIGRIFEFVHGEDAAAPLLGPGNLPQVVEALRSAIRDAPHIAEKVCYAISQLAAGFEEQGGTSPMSPYFKDIVQALLETASRPAEQAEQTRLQTQAFEAINEVVRASAADTTPMVVQLIPLVISKINETLHINAASGVDAAERQREMQGLLCGMTLVIVQKLSESEVAKGGVLQYADHIMKALLDVFACRTASVHEEAMLAVGAMTYSCGRQFSKYMHSFFPVLQRGLAHHQEWQVCQVTVGVLGDICRAVEDGILDYCDSIMQTLLTNLQSADVHRNIKPQILSAFGDIALAIGDRFEKYLQHVVPMLQSAMVMSVQQQQSGGEDAAEYNNLLRHGILEAWAGMLNGLSKDKAEQYLKPYAPSLLDFVQAIYADTEGHDDGVLKASAALLGDIASTLTAVGLLFQQKPFVQPFLQQLDRDSTTAETANWARQMIEKALRAPQAQAPQDGGNSYVHSA
ncbi:hypothetical protein D9Q98_007516 [Chlorella vulgaris]|uniref:Importin N-terminal domain-containing protein n=1 Tax=Chlorella vulgaris TaxID=3077 RepID=A0A9D4TLC5_CHLVU|nr:hypothetical protein D9Q98_007516 [Chlorella vulgaris]